MATSRSSQASQDFVPVREVRDGVVILKNGSLRSVLMASSINFALKSEDEQNAFIIQFQNFFNSLDFTTQIYIQSRELDIRPYIATLEVAFKNTYDDLMRIQIREYMQFIKSFVEGANIMTKHFFVVVPYTPAPVDIQKGLLSNLPFGGTKTKQVAGTTDKDSFEESVSQLDQRVAIAQQGLIRTGVRTVQLDTEEVIELLYKIFNPGEQDSPIQMMGK
jgi:type IV secretory pathway VirB4 component